MKSFLAGLIRIEHEQECFRIFGLLMENGFRLKAGVYGNNDLKCEFSQICVMRSHEPFFFSHAGKYECLWLSE